MRKLAAFRKLSSPFVGDKPLDSISLCFYGDSTGIRMWNNPNDPMPIKTINMAGLQKWEETEDYIIYIDKDAVMTTVQKYATGTFQTFQERISDIESSQELMKSYSIEWTEQDSINLINEINNEALVKLEQSAMMLPVDGENEVEPIILEPKTVPTTYECCFRMDKKSGEFYIGEGYENLFTNFSLYSSDLFEVTRIENNIDIVWKGPSGRNSFNIGSVNLAVNIDDNISINFKTNKPSSCVNAVSTAPSNTLHNSLSFTTTVADSSIRPRANNFNFTENYTESISSFQITKTSTPKPFVKSVMPSGKLAFVTNATSDTHSFVMKGMSQLPSQTERYIFFTKSSSFALGERFEYSAETKEVICSKLYKNTGGFVTPSNNTNEIMFSGNFRPYNRQTQSFTQLLIYKANLTETELKAELAKDIKLR